MNISIFNLLRKSCRLLKNQFSPKLYALRPISNCIKTNTLKTWGMNTLLLNTAVYSTKIDKKPKLQTITPTKTHFSLIKDECTDSEIKINELIKCLESAITDTCEKYRSCLKHQIELLEQGVEMDPTDKHFDKLIPFRDEANNLKQDFETYKGMVSYIGQLAFNLAFCSALMCNLDAKDYVCNEYFVLEKIAHEQTAENKHAEEELLRKNMQNIINLKNGPLTHLKNMAAVLINKPIIENVLCSVDQTKSVENRKSSEDKINTVK